MSWCRKVAKNVCLMFKEIEHHGLAVILSETNKKVQKDTTAGQGTYFLYKPGKQESKNTPPQKKGLLIPGI